MLTAGITQEQILLLKWLSEEETSSYGECRGADLDALVDAGFATVKKPNTRWGTRPSPDYDPVSITDLGRAGVRPADRRGGCRSAGRGVPGLVYRVLGVGGGEMVAIPETISPEALAEQIGGSDTVRLSKAPYKARTEIDRLRQAPIWER